MCGSNPTVTITVNATSRLPFPPTLSDGTNISSTEDGDVNFVTLVTAGTNIVFKFSGDITAITAITYTGEANVFSTSPTRQGDGSWTGVIGSFAKDTEETYSISYVVDGQTYTQDPKIRLNQ